MKLQTVIGLCFAVAAFSSCSSSDDNNTTTNNTTANNTTANNTTPANNTTSGGGEFLRASGTINGVAFSVDCDPDDEVTSSFTSGGYLGHDSCAPAVGNHQIQCATTEQGIGGVMGPVNVNLSVNTAADDTVSLGGSLDVVQLNVNSPNHAGTTVTVDTFEADVGTSGSFTASWTDDGSGGYGEVSGTFNFNCDE